MDVLNAKIHKYLPYKCNKGARPRKWEVLGKVSDFAVLGFSVSWGSWFSLVLLPLGFGTSPCGAGYDARSRTHTMEYQYTTAAMGLGVGTPAQSVYRNDVKVLVPAKAGFIMLGAYAIADAFR